MSFGEDLKAEFKNVVIGTVLTSGKCIITVEGYSEGEIDYDAQKHIKGWDKETKSYNKEKECHWVRTEYSDFKEKTVWDSNDTYNGKDVTIIEVDYVDCCCGAYKKKKIRYDGTTAAFIPLMFMEPHNFDHSF